MQVVINDPREYEAAEKRQALCVAMGIGVPERRHKCMDCGVKFRAKPQLKAGDPRVVCQCLSDNVVVFD